MSGAPSSPQKRPPVVTKTNRTTTPNDAPGYHLPPTSPSPGLGNATGLNGSAHQSMATGTPSKFRPNTTPISQLMQASPQKALVGARVIRPTTTTPQLTSSPSLSSYAVNNQMTMLPPSLDVDAFSPLNHNIPQPPMPDSDRMMGELVHSDDIMESIEGMPTPDATLNANPHGSRGSPAPASHTAVTVTTSGDATTAASSQNGNGRHSYTREERSAYERPSPMSTEANTPQRSPETSALVALGASPDMRNVATSTTQLASGSPGNAASPLGPRSMSGSGSPNGAHGGHLQSAPTPTAPSRVNWTKGDLLGKGSYGNVYRAMDLDTNRMIAVKEILFNKDETLAKQVEKIRWEVGLMQRLDHPNIVKYLGAKRRDNQLYIYMEFMPGGSLAGVLKVYGPLQEMQATKYIRQVLLGLQYLHNRDKPVLHRDLKGENLLVDVDGTLKLADFGTSKEMKSMNKQNTVAGTPYFMAPEVIKGELHVPATDVWSVGAVVIEMLTGKPPFSNFENAFAAMMFIANEVTPQIIQDQLPPSSSDAARDFVAVCMRRDAEKRATCDALLNHVWLRGSGPSPMSTTPLPPVPHATPAKAGKPRAAGAPPVVATTPPPAQRKTPPPQAQLPTPKATPKRQGSGLGIKPGGVSTLGRKSSVTMSTNPKPGSSTGVRSGLPVPKPKSGGRSSFASKLPQAKQKAAALEVEKLSARRDPEDDFNPMMTVESQS